MEATLTMIALGLLLFVAIVLFCNELYYRKRISALGLIVLACTCYLGWYLHNLNMGMLELIEQLSKYQPVKLPKGE